MFEARETPTHLWILVLCCFVSVGGEFIILTGGESRAIQCGSIRIVIEKVFYGGSDFGSLCSKPDAWKDIVRDCFNKPSCTLNSIMVNNPDPCPGINKKLEITYTCTEAKYILDNCLAVNTKLEVGKPIFAISPNYPQYYASGLDCEMYISAPDLTFRSDLKIEVIFMLMEENQNAGGCYDKLIIQEPQTVLNARSYEYCGNTPEYSQNPVTLIMEGAKISTVTDQMTNKEGFVVKITNIAWYTSCPVPHVCLNGAACTQSISGTHKHCECVAGYSGSTCAIGSPGNVICNPNPCFNNGQCIVESTVAYRCNCQMGWIGSNCQTAQITPCVSSPCKNNGVCVRQSNTEYVCSCSAGFSGVSCQTQNLVSCSPNPCKNNGVCTVNNGIPSCTCPTGYGGALCDMSCSPNPCKNNGVCTMTNGVQSCACQTGYGGALCDMSCSPNPCKNSGVCTVNNGILSCACPIGYKGALCETYSNLCIPCKNGGTCIQTQLGPMCNCELNFYGPRCESYGPDNCVNHACEIGSTCIDDNDAYRCVCPFGFKGKYCTESSAGTVAGSGTSMAPTMGILLVMLTTLFLFE